MKILTLQQGSDAWLAHRRTTRNASEAPAMMGASPYVSRADLVRQHSTGIEREIDAATQAVFDRGHTVEPALRALAEKIIGEDLYPVTGVADDGYLGASFDGVTLAEDVIFEAKQHNAEKRACVYAGEIPPADYWQIVQQFAVCASAMQCLYLCGDGTETNTAQLWIERSQVEADIPKLLAGWQQFDADVAAYQPAPTAAPAAVGRTPDQLPALHIEVTGMVTASNLAQWKEAAIAVFQGISTDLQTDQDFADAERTVKWCGDIETQLKAAKAHALSQTASIDELFRTIDAIAEEARGKRLQLDKLVKSRKEDIRAEIVQRGVDAVQGHYRTINATLGEFALQTPATLRTDLAQAIKGRKTVASLNDAVDAAVASTKIDASQTAERVRANIAVLTSDAAGFESLFADRRQLVATKAPDDLRNLVKARITEHEEREAARLEQERERIRQEEADRLAREQAEATQQATSAPDGRMADMIEHGMSGVDWSPAANGAQQSAPSPAKPVPQSARIKLGDLNAAIAPLSITAEGLASLGFKPVANQGAAKLYAASDFPRICAALARVIANALAAKDLALAA